MTSDNFQDDSGQPDLPPLNDVSAIGDSRRPLIRAARGGVIALIIITVLSLSLWGAFRDLPGLYGALIGAGLGGGFLLITVFVVLGTANSSPSTTMAAVLGSWLAKAAVLLVILIWIRDMTFYDPIALAVTVILVLVALLATETIAVTRTQLMYVPEN